MKSSFSMSVPRAILEAPRTWLALQFALVLACVPGLMRLESDNSPSAFLERESSALATYQHFRLQFGGDNFVRVVLRSDRADDPGLFRRMERAAETLGGLQGISGVHSVIDHYAALGEWPPYDAAWFARQVRQNPLDRAMGWRSKDGRRWSLLVQIASRNPIRERQALERIESALTRIGEKGHFEIAGLAELNRTLDRYGAETAIRFFPALVACGVLMLFILLRCPRAVSMPLIFVAALQVVVHGLMGYAGARLNLLLLILPPLLFAVGLATAMHLILALRRHLEAAPELSLNEALAATYREKFSATAWASITTMVGFASLATSEVQAIQTLAFWLTLGIALVWLGVLFFLPALIMSLGGLRYDRRGLPPSGPAPELSWGASLTSFVTRHPGKIVLLAFLSAGASLAALRWLPQETNALHYLPNRSPTRQNIERAEDAGMPIAAFELWVRSPSTADFTTPDRLQGLRQAEKEIRALPGVLAVVGPGLFIDETIARNPESRWLSKSEAEAAAIALLRGQEKSPFEQLFATKGREARMTIFHRMEGAQGLSRLEGALPRIISRTLPGSRFDFTGLYVLALRIQRYLMHTLSTSLISSLAIISLIFAWLLRNPLKVVIALIPNLWPLAMTFGAAALLRIPLDLATVMVAAIVLGLAVDNTIHTLLGLQEEPENRSPDRAIVRVLAQNAPAYISTALVLIAGFASLAPSPFAPTARFGVLAAMAIFWSLVGDLFLLPALLACAGCKGSAAARASTLPPPSQAEELHG